MLIGVGVLLGVGRGTALAGAKREVREAFAEWRALSAEFDPALGELYRDDASIRVTRQRADGQVQSMVLPGAELKGMLGALLDEARTLGDVDTFSGVRLTREGQAWRVAATRTNHLKCYDDPDFYQLWQQGEDGIWRVAVENLGTRELSSCPGAGSPLSQVLAIQERALRSQLPVPIDEVTFMTGVEVVGDTLTYRVSLPSVPVAAVDVEAFSQTVEEAARQSACQSRDPRLLLDLGATLIVSYSDREGVVFTEVRTVREDCP